MLSIVTSKPQVIKFVAFISRNDKPLYLQSFEPEIDANSFLKYNFLSHMALDIFASPASLQLKEQQKVSDSDALLLFIQDGVSVYGYESNTNLKIIIGLGVENSERSNTQSAPISERKATLNTLISQIHKTYLRAICNPFTNITGDNETTLLQSEKFDNEIKKLVEQWKSFQ